ncbi:hypothetical protein [Brevundimonas faecalis]|uniref:NTP pyrophosphatase (Non-canonical NTP hydrolase) n=1 Tax=Brevundimonas faecalis TaxID=947378 RepID=A0ABV2RAW2_9CAUL
MSDRTFPKPANVGRSDAARTVLITALRPPTQDFEAARAWIKQQREQHLSDRAVDAVDQILNWIEISAQAADWQSAPFGAPVCLGVDLAEDAPQELKDWAGEWSRLEIERLNAVIALYAKAVGRWQKQAVVAEAELATLRPQPQACEEAQPIALAVGSAPRDGTVLRLNVRYNADNREEAWTPLEDSEESWTIGFNNFDNTGDDRWQFVGWDWSQDQLLEATGGTVIGWLPFHSHTAKAPAPAPMNWVSRVMEIREEGDGVWQACSGCQESVDGYVSTQDYPYSAAFGCQPGGGCSECGGLGVKWDTTDYDAMATSMLADMEAEEGRADALTVADLRPEVMTFALLMERQLRENDWKGGWSDDAPEALLKRLREETSELTQEIENAGDRVWRDWDPDAYAKAGPSAPAVIVRFRPHKGWFCANIHTPKRFNPDADATARIGSEAADVANFAMMIADNAGALSASARGEAGADA